MKARVGTLLYRATGGFLFFLIWTAGVSAGDLPERDWHLSFSAVYSGRGLDGSIINKSALNNDVFGSLVATGDSMNVGSSKGFMLSAGAQYKRWGLSLNYMPTSFSGDGSAIVDVGGSDAGARFKTGLSTDIDIEMVLGNLSYNFIQTENMVFGIGAGFGRTSIDLNIIPAIGNSIVYDGEQPFGFLNMHMANSYKKFLYGFSVNGISGTFDGVFVDYSDYKIDVGYRAIDRYVKCDIVGGYRKVNFAINIESDQETVATKVTMEGPFLGLNLTY